MRLTPVLPGFFRFLRLNRWLNDSPDITEREIFFRSNSMNTANCFDSPTAWFVLLERARRCRDQDLERWALAELRRLGVKVEFGKAGIFREGQEITNAS